VDAPLGVMSDFEMRSSGSKEWTNAELKKFLAMTRRRRGVAEITAAIGDVQVR